MAHLWFWKVGGVRAPGAAWIGVAVGQGVGGGAGGLPVSVKQEAGLCLQVGVGVCPEEV